MTSDVLLPEMASYPTHPQHRWPCYNSESLKSCGFSGNIHRTLWIVSVPVEKRQETSSVIVYIVVV